MLKSVSKTTSPTAVSEALLKELLDATQTQDMLDAAQLLKRLMAPFGISSMSYTKDDFTREDVRLLKALWRECLDLHPHTQDIRPTALDLYSSFCATLHDPSCVELHEVAKEHCKKIASVCTRILREVHSLSFERTAPKQNRDGLKVICGDQS